MNKRIQKLIEGMKPLGIDTLIITDSKNMHYYSGMRDGEGCLLISESGCTVYTDSRYTEYAQSVCKGFDVCDSAAYKIGELIAPGNVCGFENLSISYSRYLSLSKAAETLIPAGDLTVSLRQIKDESELKYIREAVAIADRAFEHICSYIRVGMTEKEIAAEIDCFMLKNGGEGNSFDTIVAAGERGSLPHAIPTDRPVKEGELVVMDYGCKVGGYCSDMTRTVATGNVSQELKAVYDTVLDAQLSALDGVCAGAGADKVDLIARSKLDSVYPGCFGHSLGHGVGLDIHESPNLSPKNPRLLEAGNVVTVEPGVYIPQKCGVRTEDMVVVTENGCEILTKSPKIMVKVG